MIPTWQRSSPGNHGCGKIDRIDAFYLVHKTTSQIPGSTSHIEDSAWLISDQGDKLVNGFIRVRTPVMIDFNKARIFELFCILLQALQIIAPICMF